MADLEELRLVEANLSTPTHPAGCIAVTGGDLDMGRIRWALRVNTCTVDHPTTHADLRVQYDAEGWSNLDEWPEDLA